MQGASQLLQGMAVGLLKDMVGNLPQGAALLGLDVGKKTIGVALGNAVQGVATPLFTLRRIKFTQDAQALSKLVTEHEVQGFVVGLPLNMDGSEGRQAQSVRDFALELAKFQQSLGIVPWIALWDERLSTKTVEEFVDNSVHKRKTRVEAKDKGVIDSLAAQLILQSAIDYIRASGHSA